MKVFPEEGVPVGFDFIYPMPDCLACDGTGAEDYIDNGQPPVERKMENHEGRWRRELGVPGLLDEDPTPRVGIRSGQVGRCSLITSCLRKSRSPRENVLHGEIAMLGLQDRKSEELIIYGHSDDTVEVNGFMDESYSCYDQDVELTIKDGGAGLVLIMKYENEGTWSAKVRLIEEDVPMLPVTIMSSEGYSVNVKIKCSKKVEIESNV